MDLKQQNLIELRQLAKQELGIAAFVGAGCSYALKIPLWTEMLIGLNELFRYYSSNQDLVDDIKINDFPIVASNIKNKAGTDELAYKKALRSFLKPVACHFTSLHVELIRLTKLLMTTNYDMSFEETLQCIGRVDEKLKLEFKSSSLGSFSHHGWGYIHNIFHLHGDVSSADIILTFESYQENYLNSNTGVARLIGDIFEHYTTVFIGFSFNDTFFMDFLKNMLDNIKTEKSRYQQTRPQHYCIIGDDIIKDYITIEELLAEDANINLLVDEEILIRDELTPGKVKFRFGPSANVVIERYNGELQANQFLINILKTIAERKEKLHLLEQLEIKPIYFDENQYLQIELILRELNDAPPAVATGFKPESL